MAGEIVVKERARDEHDTICKNGDPAGPSRPPAARFHLVSSIGCLVRFHLARINSP